MIKNLNDLMSDIKLRKKYQKKSIETSKNYNYEKIEESNLNFYKNIESLDIYSSIYKESKDTCYGLIKNKLVNKEKTFIITANPETYMLAEKDPEINEILYNE